MRGGRTVNPNDTQKIMSLYVPMTLYLLAGVRRDR